MSPGAGRWRTLAADFELSLFLPFFGGLQVSFPDGVAHGGGKRHDWLFRRRSPPFFFGYDLPGGLDRRKRLVSQRAEAQCRRRSIYELLRTYPIANGYRRITSDKPDSLVA